MECGRTHEDHIGYLRMRQGNRVLDQGAFDADEGARHAVADPLGLVLVHSDHAHGVHQFAQVAGCRGNHHQLAVGPEHSRELGYVAWREHRQRKVDHLIGDRKGLPAISDDGTDLPGQPTELPRRDLREVDADAAPARRIDRGRQVVPGTRTHVENRCARRALIAYRGENRVVETRVQESCSGTEHLGGVRTKTAPPAPEQADVSLLRDVETMAAGAPESAVGALEWCPAHRTTQEIDHCRKHGRSSPCCCCVSPDQAVTPRSSSPNAAASSEVSSTTSRPPPSMGMRTTIPRPSLVASRGPSPVRGFIAAISAPFRFAAAVGVEV